MANPINHRAPPLAGKPPFATDLPDSIYTPQPERTPYNMYDQYLDEKENPFTDANQVKPKQLIPLAAPQPGYAAPVAALKLPSPAATPVGRTTEMSQYGGQMASQQGGIPNAPHPLQAPMTPIAPVFARPSTATGNKDVRFASPAPIMRGENEETLLPRRGQKGDDFWRRFSMVVHEDMAAGPGQKQSMWLRKTQSGKTRMSRWVWIVGLTILIVIAGAIGLGWWASHKDTSHDAPSTFFGKSDNAGVPTPTVAGGAQVSGSTSTTRHVSPTNTVERRGDFAPEVTARAHLAAVHRTHRKQQRSNTNRTSDH